MYREVFPVEHYYHVQEVRDGKIVTSAVFLQEPKPIMSTRDPDRIDAFEGLSPFGVLTKFRGVAKFPDYKVVDLGRLSAPRFRVGQRFHYKGRSDLLYRIVGVSWHRGWRYRACPVVRRHVRLGERWIAEKTLQAQKKIVLLDG